MPLCVVPGSLFGRRQSYGAAHIWAANFRKTGIAKAPTNGYHRPPTPFSRLHRQCTLNLIEIGRPRKLTIYFQKCRWLAYMKCEAHRSTRRLFWPSSGSCGCLRTEQRSSDLESVNMGYWQLVLILLEASSKVRRRYRGLPVYSRYRFQTDRCLVCKDMTKIVLGRIPCSLCNSMRLQPKYSPNNWSWWF